MVVNTEEACQLTMGSSFETEMTLHSKEGQFIPPIALNDAVTIVHNGNVVLEGVFRHDD